MRYLQTMRAVTSHRQHLQPRRRQTHDLEKPDAISLIEAVTFKPQPHRPGTL